MVLVYNCSGCKKENIFKPKLPDRGLLQEQMGDEVKVNCTSCGKMENKYINRIEAVADKRFIYLTIAIAIVFAGLLWYYIGGISSTIFLLPFSAWIYESKAASTFNRYKIKRK